MNRLRSWVLRLGGLWRSGRRERELADEIEAHIRLHTDDNLRSGMSPAQARREAILRLGGVESTKEAWRERSTIPFLDHLLQDIRFSLRQLRKNPGFSATAILTLGLGMCASVSIFAFVDATLIKPLPYRDPGRLTGVYESIPLCPRCDLSYPDYVDWKRLNTVFSSLDVYEGHNFMLASPSGAQPAHGAEVTAGFFRTLGIVPALGRDFMEGEDQPAAPRTVMLSYDAWQKRYGGRADVIGQNVALNGEPNTIVGVLPREFHFAPVGPAEFWTALHAVNSCFQTRSCHSLLGVARLKDGATVETANVNLSLIAGQLEKQYPDSNRGQQAKIVALTDVIVGDVRPILIVLLSGAALLLVIAGVNVAGLLLVRSENRRREMAVRSGLGASPGRLLCHFATEGVILAAAGAACGIVGAHWTMRLLAALVPVDMMAGMPYLIGLGLNYRVLAFAGAMALLAAIVFSLTPALRLSFSDLRAGLAEGARGSAGTTWRRFGSNLVVVELATAMVLLTAAGLLGKSLYRLLQTDIGIEPDRIATVRVGAPESIYAKKAAALGRTVVSRIQELPGVESAAITSRLPLIGGDTMWIRVVGHPYRGEHNEVTYREVSPAYFRTLRARLLRGRFFTEADDASKPPVVVIDAALAKKYFPGEDPIGKQILYAPNSTTPPMEVIGIVDNIKEGELDKANWPTMYVAFDQDPTTHFAIVARTKLPEHLILPTLAATIRRIDPGIVMFNATTMRTQIDNSPAAYLRRSSAWLVGGFAALALLLGVVGLYGVTAYSVSRRTREIGVRIALGARPLVVYRLILREAGWLIALGIGIGMACAMASATLLGALLYGVRAWDAATLAAVAAILGGAALAASYIPARRAASVNPSEALRAE